MRHSLIGSGSGLHREYAFSPHIFVVLHVIECFDEAVWAWRGRVRELEIERQRQILNSSHESSNMHETMRHLIHCSEMLVTAMSTIQQMGKKAVAFPVFNHSADNSTVQNNLDFHTSLLTSYLNRSKALEARMQNEISLVRLLVAVLMHGSVVENSTLVFFKKSRRGSRTPPPGEKLPRVNASRFQLEANCMHVVKLKRVAMQP
jgi:hypothetical protein